MKKIKDIKSLYIHIPFCESLCDYCDFPKLQYFRNFGVDYLKALKKEFEYRQIGTLKTIYIGGGTPTSLDDDLFEELLKMVYSFTKGVEEYTIECNPESLTLNKIKMMKKYGVNRVSIGVESTNDQILKSINRHHTFLDVKKAVELLRENGIDNINLDLILGLPNVTKKMLEQDVTNIISLNPKHISCYSLTVHPHTVFYLNEIKEPDSDFSYENYKMVNQLLEKAGYRHYEVSNWAIAGYESKHNMTYWLNEHYYGIGYAASGYIGDIRYQNSSNFQEYLKGNFQGESEKITSKDEITYQIMLNLRLADGLNLKSFKNKFNKDLFKEKEEKINSYIDSRHLYIEGECLKPTFDGMMILDQILLDLID